MTFFSIRRSAIGFGSQLDRKPRDQPRIKSYLMVRGPSLPSITDRQTSRAKSAHRATPAVGSKTPHQATDLHKTLPTAISSVPRLLKKDTGLRPWPTAKETAKETETAWDNASPQGPGGTVLNRPEQAGGSLPPASSCSKTLHLSCAPLGMPVTLPWDAHVTPSVREGECSFKLSGTWAS